MGVRMRGASRWMAVTASLLLTGVASPVDAQSAAGDPWAPAERAVLEGTASYWERMRLPPGAVFEAQSEDTGPPAVTTSTQSAPSFEKTRWAASKLGATDVTATGPRAPHLVFEGGRVSGSDGCNRVSGGYTVDGHALTFGPMVGTQMACPGTGEVERAFGAAVRDTRRWRIAGQTLELLDGKGDIVARLEAPGAQ